MKSLFYGPMLAVFAFMFLFSSAVSAEPALLIGIDGCVLLDGNGNAVVGTGVTIDSRSANDALTHICSTDVAPPASGHAAIFNVDSWAPYRVLCGIDDGEGGDLAQTEDWHEVVSASGKAKLVCQFHTAAN